VTGAGTGTLTAFEGSVQGAAGDDAFGANLDLTGPGDDGVGINLLVQGFSDDNTGINSTVNASGISTTAFGIRSTTSGGTATNIAFDATAAGVGSIGLRVNAGARTGVHVTDLSDLGQSTGVYIRQTVATNLAAGVRVDNVGMGTISNGMVVEDQAGGSITAGFRAISTDVGFEAGGPSMPIGYNYGNSTGTGFQATAITSGTGFLGSVNGGGTGVVGTVTGGTGTGVRGSATNPGAAGLSSVGVEATGNGDPDPGETTIALEVTRGEITMGREAGAQGAGVTAVETSPFEGPSGVVDASFAFPAHGAATSVVSNADLTINNQHVRPNSIILVTVLGQAGGATAGEGHTIQVINRAAGSFTVRALETSTAGIVAGNSTVRFGYMIINPDR
jgi:trimeric autotransporter adhesin